MIKIRNRFVDDISVSEKEETDALDDYLKTRTLKPLICLVATAAYVSMSVISLGVKIMKPYRNNRSFCARSGCFVL